MNINGSVSGGSVNGESRQFYTGSETDSVTRLSFGSHVAATERDDAFETAAKQARGDEHSAVSSFCRDVAKKVLTIQGAFVTTGLLSCFSMIWFSAITMGVVKDCEVFEPSGRCCSCLQLNESRVVGQTMPRKDTYNNVFYGSTIVLNALFGIVYIVEAVRNENRFQIVCSLVSQIISVIRASVDVGLETKVFFHQHRGMRIGAVVCALLFSLISAALTPALFKKFTWIVFRKSSGNPKQRRIYELYQLCRALNWLETQAAWVFYLAVGLYLNYVREYGVWPFATVVGLDIISSRQLIHHLKRERIPGCLLAIASKIFVLVYCGIVAAEYVMCRFRFLDSLRKSETFWEMPGAYVDFLSVRDTYNGRSCTTPGTSHDDRTIEVFMISFVLIAVFRIGSIIVLFRVLLLFSGSLKSLFYKEKQRPRGGARDRDRKPRSDRLLEDESLATQSAMGDDYLDGDGGGAVPSFKSGTGSAGGGSGGVAAGGGPTMSGGGPTMSGGALSASDQSLSSMTNSTKSKRTPTSAATAAPGRLNVSRNVSERVRRGAANPQSRRTLGEQVLQGSSSAVQSVNALEEDPESETAW